MWYTSGTGCDKQSLGSKHPTLLGVAQPKGFLMRTAVLVDGGFFLKRYRALKGSRTPSEVAKALHAMCLAHLSEKKPRKPNDLYRIFYYDCPPLLKKAHNPVSGKAIDFASTPTAKWKLAFLDELKKLRKVAVRLGYLSALADWTLNQEVLKRLLKGEITFDNVTDRDVRYDVRQKGVDVRLGLDIASLAYKKQVEQIVLVSGDSDFVPAAKLARREGIDFILDPMWSHIREDLHEHIDGLKSVIPRPEGS